MVCDVQRRAKIILYIYVLAHVIMKIRSHALLPWMVVIFFVCILLNACEIKPKGTLIIIPYNDDYMSLNSIDGNRNFDWDSSSIKVDSINFPIKTISLTEGDHTLSFKSDYDDMIDTLIKLKGRLIINSYSIFTTYYDIITQEEDHEIDSNSDRGIDSGKIPSLVCDQFNESNELYIEKIERGCFHHHSIRTIYKKKKEYTLITTIDNGRVFLPIKGSVDIKDSLMNFEKEIRNLPQENCFCTNSTQYIIKCGRKIFRSMDFYNCKEFIPHLK